MKLNRKELNLPVRSSTPQQFPSILPRSTSSPPRPNPRIPSNYDPFEDMDEALLNLDVECRSCFFHLFSLPSVALANSHRHSGVQNSSTRNLDVTPYSNSSRSTFQPITQNRMPMEFRTAQPPNQDLVSLLQQRAELDAKIAALTNQSHNSISSQICLDLTKEGGTFEQKRAQHFPLSTSASEGKSMNPCDSFSYSKPSYASSWDDHPLEIQERLMVDYPTPSVVEYSKSNVDFDGPFCSCGTPCVKLVSRTSSNMNREFYKCSNEFNQCNFFQWVDGEVSRSIQSSMSLDPSSIKDFVVANKRIFGHNFFREGQKECIEAAMQGTLQLIWI